MERPGVSQQEIGVKRSPFEDLTRDELVTKCKGLLVIAQKAKQGKQELQNEVESYKLQIEKYESEKKQSDESYKTLQELVDSLTEQKLNIITEVDAAQSKIKALNLQCKNYEIEINKYKSDLIIRDQNVTDISMRLSDLDSEATSLKRQNKRLVDENEQLINQLTEIEAKTAEFNNIGLQQREQLKILEESVQSDEELKMKVNELNSKINVLEAANDDYVKQKENYESTIKEFKDLYESEKSKKDKANVKLRSYKDKILKCAACIIQLKNSRFILTKTIKEYSENIPKWQNDIIKASKILDEQIKQLSNENIALKEQVKQLQEEIQVTKKQSETNNEIDASKIGILDEEIQLLKRKIEELQHQNNNILKNNEDLQSELGSLKVVNEQLSKIDLPVLTNENTFLQDQIKDINKKCEALSQVNKELTKKIDELRYDNQQLKQSSNIKPESNIDIENLRYQIKALESEKATLVKEKFNVKDSVVELENSNKLLTDQNTKLNLDIQTIKQDLERALRENSAYQKDINVEREGEINILKCKIMTQQEQFDLLKKEYDDVQDMNNLLKEEVETLKLSLEQPRDENLSDLNVSLQADIAKLETKLAAYKQENSSLLTEMKESRNKIKDFDKLTAEYEEHKSQLLNYKSENAELLSEMKEINQVLKERWECMSKQQKAISEMEILIETFEKERDSAKEERNELIKKIECLETELKDSKNISNENSETINQLTVERDNAIKQLTENEVIISTLREELEKLKQQSSSGELPNDDMSTSTISKAEDYSRMKDLDETFEEKYTKLRIFALKLKKKLNETVTLLQNTEKDKARLEKILNEGGQNGRNTTEAESASDSSTDIKPTGDNNQELIDLQTQVKSLTSAAEAAGQISEELEKVKAELTAKSQELASEIEAHKATKDSLDKARKDIKKKSVLSLEMEDYERSLKELTAKMEEKKKKMVQMESTIDTQEGTITAMKTQIKLLEEQIKIEETQNRLTKEELQHAYEEVRDKDNVIQTKNTVIAKLEQDIEAERRKNEESDLEMTTLISDKEKVIMNLAEEKAELNNKVKRLEFKCTELAEKLKITDMELADLKTEYTSYKVRAQAVLRQNQTIDHSQEEQLKEEAAALRAQIETLSSKLSTAQEQCAEQSTEADNARRRASEAAGEVARAQQRTARLQADLTRLSQQLDSERTQHKLQVSTLTQCYKTQISDLETKLVKETESLRKQLVSLQESATTRRVSLDEANHNQYMLPVIPKDDSDGEMDINVSMIPREEGEGSESAPSPPPSKPYTGAGSRRSPVPLERLLEEGVPEDDTLDTSSLDLTSDQEIADLKRRLAAQQQRVKHVTVLLSESERECARMAQLAELLKAELRRVRGTTSNAHNTEYMKNVTLKFLTLPAGDERGRLVPVLQKILTLTPEETQKIDAVAKGLDPNPSKGWGSYLPWPGGSK